MVFPSNVSKHTPHLVWYIAFTFFGINLTKPYGPFFILAALDAFFCSWVFRKHAKQDDASVVTMTKTVTVRTIT
uniref:Inner membrane protein n=1 Tax=Panagrellus redivivus TaxID=6233 RepID=A0A7E4ZU50_PANRE